MSQVYDDTVCSLGEGPLWHPERGQLYWFDIHGSALHTRENGTHRSWPFDENVSAAGWTDDTHLLVASETRLFRFNVETGATEDVIGVEADNPETRSNDGRADPWGGFWIGTMAKHERTPDGTFYRYYRGELRPLYEGITIPNACCFTPDRKYAYFCDTIDNVVKRVTLDPETGWPDAEPQVWLDLSGEPWGVDGAVIDADGNFWNAQWNGWRAACYAPDGTLTRTVDVGGAHSSCPAFGGPDLTTLFVTTAAGRVTDEDRARSSDHGKVFAQENVARGQAEHRVLL
ncbi:MAG: SMP-30/gluconolactonase/LRE family protein [Silicimonas sp.]|nr:SMP-30/gluconolactonase/LRE family protein [Silicimonas sp.]